MPQNPGLEPEVQQAIQRRQGPQPALNQVSQGASNAPKMPPPTTPSQISPAPQASQPQQAQAPAKPKYEAQNQDDLIVMALIEKMKTNDKMKKEQITMSAQPAPQAGNSKPMGGSNFSMSSGFEQPMSVNQMQGDYNFGLGKDYSGVNNFGKGF